MMTAAEYRRLARSAHDRATALSNSELTAELFDHARQWDRLARGADLQDQLVAALAIMPPATAG